jgi:hypothetical protein
MAKVLHLTLVTADERLLGLGQIATLANRALLITSVPRISAFRTECKNPPAPVLLCYLFIENYQTLHTRGNFVKDT